MVDMAVVFKLKIDVHYRHKTKHYVAIKLSQ